MPLYDTDSLIVVLSGAGDLLPDPIFTPERTHHLINPTGAAAIVGSTGATPFTDIGGVDVATVTVPARGSVTVKTNGTHWVVRPDDFEWLPNKNSVLVLDPQTDQFLRFEIIDDGSPSGVWPNRREIFYTGPAGSPARHRVSWDNEFGEGRYTAAKNSTVPFRIYLQEAAGVITHTVNGFEVVDNPTDRNVLFFVDGSVAGAGRISGYVEPYTFSVQGVLTVQAGASRIYLEGDYLVESVRAAVGTAPTGAAAIVDVNKNGTSIYSATPANRPTIAIGANSALGGTPTTATFAAGDYLTVDVDQIGSTVAGSDLTVTVRLRRMV